ncbi:unnamed protein product [Camellia sinensis]
MVFKAQTNMDLNLLPNRGPAEDLSSSSLSIDKSVVILHQMIEESGGIPTQWLTSSVPCESGIVDRDPQGQKPTTDEQVKLTQLSLGNFARNTSQPLPRLPDHEETYNHEVQPSPPCKRVELSSSEGKDRTYKKFSFEEMEKLIEGVEKYGGKYCNCEKWRYMKKSANKQTDPHLKKLYVRALKVQMSPPKSKSSKWSSQIPI